MAEDTFSITQYEAVKAFGKLIITKMNSDYMMDLFILSWFWMLHPRNAYDGD